MTSSPGSGWWRVKVGLCAAGIALAMGCGSHYSLRTERSSIILQWPYQPGIAKVTYLESITGLGRRKNLKTTLRSIIYGNEKDDLNAFVLPVAVATAADGRIAVADQGRRCVHLYVPGDQSYVRLLGSAEHPIASPVDVEFDGELRLYVSDSSGKVFLFGPSGEFVRVLQTAGEEPLRRPTGLAYSPGTRLVYVVDTLANKVYGFGRDGDLALAFGERGMGEGQFNFPTHICRSDRGELFVTDALNFRVEIFDERGGYVGSFGHHGDGSGDLAMPKGLAVDRDGIVYVVDAIFDNVQLFNRRGNFLLTLGKRGTYPGEFWLPSGIVIGGDGKLYVCDTYNRRVQVFSITGGYANGSS